MDQSFSQTLRSAAVLALDGRFQQSKLVSCRQFETLLRDREATVDLGKMWRLGLLRPLVIDGPVPASLAEWGFCEITSFSDDHEHWMDARPMPPSIPPEMDNWADLPIFPQQAWYHPVQVIQAYSIVRALSVGALHDGLVDEPTFLENAKREWSRARKTVDQLLISWRTADNYRLTAFLIAISPIATARLTSTMTFDLLAGESFEQYWSWRSLHKPESILRMLSVTEGDIDRWHSDLAVAASLLDPLDEWHDLLVNIKRKLWSQARGKTLLAYELRWAAEMIRSYAREYLDMALPTEQERRYGPQAAEVARLRYGVPDTVGGGRDVRRRVSREFGLDGEVRVVWAVEGDTEEAFIDVYGASTGLSARHAGVTLLNIRGAGGLGNARVWDRLREAHAQDQFVHVTIDGDVRKTTDPALRRLREADLLTAGFMTLDGDFEQANFTDDELADVIHLMAVELGVSAAVTGHQIGRQRAKGLSSGDAIKACLRGTSLWGGKGKKWGRRLASWALDHPRSGGEDRPIVAELMTVLRASLLNYTLNSTRFRCGANGQMVPKDDAVVG